MSDGKGKTEGGRRKERWGHLGFGIWELGADQHLAGLFENAPIPALVDAGQRAPSDAAAIAQVVKPLRDRVQARLDLPRTLPVRRLRERQGKKLGPAGEALMARTPSCRNSSATPNPQRHGEPANTAIEFKSKTLKMRSSVLSIKTLHHLARQPLDNRDPKSQIRNPKCLFRLPPLVFGTRGLGDWEKSKPGGRGRPPHGFRVGVFRLSSRVSPLVSLSRPRLPRLLKILQFPDPGTFSKALRFIDQHSGVLAGGVPVEARRGALRISYPRRMP